MGEKYCKKRKVFNFVLKDERTEQCLISREDEFQMWGPRQEEHSKRAMDG